MTLQQFKEMWIEASTLHAKRQVFNLFSREYLKQTNILVAKELVAYEDLGRKMHRELIKLEG